MSQNFGSLLSLVTQCHTSSTPTPPLKCDLFYGCPLIARSSLCIVYMWPHNLNLFNFVHDEIISSKSKMGKKCRNLRNGNALKELIRKFIRYKKTQLGIDKCTEEQHKLMNFLALFLLHQRLNEMQFIVNMNLSVLMPNYKQ